MTPEEVSELSDDELTYFSYLEQHLAYEVFEDGPEFSGLVKVMVWGGLLLLGWGVVAAVVAVFLLVRHML